jgi:hypothetical protein
VQQEMLEELAAAWSLRWSNPEVKSAFRDERLKRVWVLVEPPFHARAYIRAGRIAPEPMEKVVELLSRVCHSVSCIVPGRGSTAATIHRAAIMMERRSLAYGRMNGKSCYTRPRT